MDLSQSAALVHSIGGDFEWLSEAGSTNSLLLQKSDAPHFSVIATDNQVAGRGRSGRVWQAPAGTSIAVSVLLRHNISGNLNQLGWLPLLAGLAMSRVVQPRVTSRVGVKWPNDVLVGERKVSGVLTELTTDLTGVVIGAGLNITLSDEQLPVPTATSLVIEGAREIETDALLADYLVKLHDLFERFAKSGFDADASGIRQEVIDACLTIGRDVRAILPADREELGRAVNIDQTGRLVILQGNQEFAVAAGDIVHMRHN